MDEYQANYHLVYEILVLYGPIASFRPPLQPASVAGSCGGLADPRGKRFAVLKAEGTQVEEKRDKVTIIQNFFEELRRIAPKGKK